MLKTLVGLVALFVGFEVLTGSKGGSSSDTKAPPAGPPPAAPPPQSTGSKLEDLAVNLAGRAGAAGVDALAAAFNRAMSGSSSTVPLPSDFQSYPSSSIVEPGDK